MDVLIALDPSMWKTGVALAKAMQTAHLRVLVLSCPKFGKVARPAFCDHAATAPTLMNISADWLIPGYDLHSAYPLGHQESQDHELGSSGWHARCINRETGQELYIVSKFLVVVPSPAECNYKETGTAAAKTSVVFDIYEQVLSKLNDAVTIRGLAWFWAACLSRPEVVDGCSDGHSAACTDEEQCRSTQCLAAKQTVTGILDPSFAAELLQTSDGSPLLQQPVPLWRGMVPTTISNLILCAYQVSPSVSDSISPDAYDPEDIALPDAATCLQAAWMTLYIAGHIRRPSLPSSQLKELRHATHNQGNETRSQAIMFRYLGQLMSDMAEGSCLTRASSLNIWSVPRACEQKELQAAPLRWVAGLMMQLGAQESTGAKLLEHAAAAAALCTSCEAARGGGSHSEQGTVSAVSAAAAAAAAAAVEGLMGQPSTRGSNVSKHSSASRGYTSNRAFSHVQMQQHCHEEFVKMLEVAPSATARIKYAALHPSSSRLMACGSTASSALGQETSFPLAFSSNCCSGMSQENVTFHTQMARTISMHELKCGHVPGYQPLHGRDTQDSRLSYEEEEEAGMEDSKAQLDRWM